MAEEMKNEQQQSTMGGSSEACMCGGCGPMTTRYLQAMLPGGDAADHFRKARLEMLKGFRALLDQRIESLSGNAGKGTKINID